MLKCSYLFDTIDGLYYTKTLLRQCFTQWKGKCGISLHCGEVGGADPRAGEG